MGTVSPGPAESEEDYIHELLRRAEEAWGPERLPLLRPMVVETARHLWQISRHLPDVEDEPAFFA